MRKPERPPDLLQTLEARGGEFARALSDDRYQALTRKCEEAYWHWDKVRFAARAAGLDPDLAWAIVKIGRAQRYTALPLTGHGGVPLRYLLPDAAQRELMLVDQQLAGRIGAEIEQPIPAEYREHFVISALQEEAIASSMLEGAATTRQDAKRLLRSGRKPRTQAEQMVVNNYRTILFIRDTLRVGLSPEYLLQIQRTITENTLREPNHVGRFRTMSDRIDVVDERDGEVMHVPPPADELGDRLKKLCDFGNTGPGARPFIHPVARACMLHFQLGFDHPFCDGNGRTARALFYWYLLRSGYWLFEFLPISPLFYRSPAKYSRAYLYSETDDFDVTYFLSYNLKVIARGRMEMRRYLERRQEQIAYARRLFKSDPSLNHRQQELLLKVARNPDLVLTIASHKNTQGIAYATARSDLLELVNSGYLEVEKRRNRFVFVRGPRLKGLNVEGSLQESEEL